MDPHYAETTGRWVVAARDSEGRERFVAEFDGPDARREANDYVVKETAPKEWTRR